jgi:hypothetical protein
MQRMRDAIVSDSGDYQLRVCNTCPENIGRVSWFSIIEFLRFELMLLKLFYKHFDQNKTQY